VTSTFPEVAAAAAAGVPGAAVLDGEVVAMDGGEALGFQRLQRRLGLADPEPALVRAAPVSLWAFDLVHLEDRDTRALEMVDRKALLRAVLRPRAALRYCEHDNGDAPGRYRAACAAGWEGLVAKRSDAPYRAGRTRDWLKLKCVGEQELVIGGYTEPKGRRAELGALLVGYYEDGRLRYAGKVGTGFDEAKLRELGGRLARLARPDSPFAEPVRPLPAGTHWVEPRLVGQIGFSEWTSAGRLRHPRFLGLREDKAPEDVVREAPT
jgi:DNA ligase D-like protein (predicted ligase)